jgi:hypothetical protein
MKSESAAKKIKMQDFFLSRADFGGATFCRWNLCSRVFLNQQSHIGKFGNSLPTAYSH